MVISRKPQLGEQVSLHIKPKQRKPGSGDAYLLTFEGKIGKIIEQGDQYAPWVYKVDFGFDLPALVRLSNLRTLEGEPFKEDKRESGEVIGTKAGAPLSDKRPSEKIKQVMRQDIAENKEA